MLNKKLIIGALLAVIILIRLPALTARTIHIDEGMGIRSSELTLSGDYHYWNKNGHGPTLFYVGAFILKQFGNNLAFFRAATATLMLLAFCLLWLFYRHQLNFIGEIVLLIGLGLSSGMLFFSTYFIHESLFIFLTVTILLSAELWIKTKQDIWLAVIIVMAGLLYMTKETALFTYAALILSVTIMLLWRKRYRLFTNLITLNTVWFAIMGFLVIGILYLLMFGKSFDLLTAPFYWLVDRGTKMHIRPWHYFITLLFLHEYFLLTGSVIIGVYLGIKKLWTPRLAFFALWLFFITVGYSVIPYKTPWLIPNMILPLGLFMALATHTVWGKNEKIVLIIIVLLIPSSVTFYLDNFIHPDRVNTYDYGYLQSGRGLQDFMGVLNGVAKLNPKEKLPVQIIAERGDELLYVITEKYNRRYEPFLSGMPIYINFMHSEEAMADILKKSGQEYIKLKFTYCAPYPCPNIDLFVRQDKWSAFQSSPAYIEPQQTWIDGTIRYN